MGNTEPVVIERMVAVNQQVEIQCPGAPVSEPLPPLGLLNSLKLVEQSVWVKPGAEPHRTINKIRLILWANRAAGVKG